MSGTMMRADPADMVGNLVAKVATWCRAEPGDLYAASHRGAGADSIGGPGAPGDQPGGTDERGHVSSEVHSRTVSGEVHSRTPDLGQLAVRSGGSR